MCKRAKRWAVAVALAVACLVGLAGTMRAAESGQQMLMAKFQQGITAYETGEYDQAAKAFDEVLAMKPGMQAAMQMRSTAEVQEFVKMRNIPQLKAQADEILKLMMRAGREATRKIDNVDQLLADFRSPEAVTYAKAAIELKGHGPYTVPFVVALLALDQPQDQVVAGRAVALLAGLQPDAVLPLCQVLANTDNSLVRQRVAGVLGQIKDGRAVPALMQVWADPKALSSTRDAAAEALKAITGKDAGRSAVRRSRLPGPGQGIPLRGRRPRRLHLRHERRRLDVESDGKDWQDKVTYEEVPAYLYYQRMATDTALTGLNAVPADTDLQSVMAAGLVRQLALCEFNKTAAMPAGQEDMADSIHADAEKRAAKLEIDVPVALRLLETPQVAGALSLTVHAADGPASLYLDKMLARKMQASGGQLPERDERGRPYGGPAVRRQGRALQRRRRPGGGLPDRRVRLAQGDHGRAQWRRRRRRPAHRPHRHARLQDHEQPHQRGAGRGRGHHGGPSGRAPDRLHALAAAVRGHRLPERQRQRRRDGAHDGLPAE